MSWNKMSASTIIVCVCLVLIIFAYNGIVFAVTDSLLDSVTDSAENPELQFTIHRTLERFICAHLHCSVSFNQTDKKSLPIQELIIYTVRDTTLLKLASVPTFAMCPDVATCSTDSVTRYHGNLTVALTDKNEWKNGGFQCRVLKGRVVTARKSIKDGLFNIDLLTETVQQLCTQSGYFEKKLADFLGNMTEVLNDNGFLKRTLDRLLTETAPIMKTLTAMLMENTSITRTCTTLLNENISINRTLEELMNEIASTKRTMDVLFIETKSMNKTLTAVLNENITLNKSLTVLSSENESMKKTITTLSSEKTSMNKTLTNLLRENTSMKKTLTAISSENTSMNKTLADLSSENTSMKKTVISMSSEITSMMKTLTALSSENTSMNKTLTALSSENTSMKKTLTALLSENTSMNKTLIEMRDRYTATEYELIQLNVLYNATETKLGLLLQELTKTKEGDKDRVSQETIPLTQCKRGMPRSQPRMKILLWNTTEALCDTETDGGGWVIIKRFKFRKIGIEKGWDEYKRGFGSVDTDYWLGLDNIHKLTSQGFTQLRWDVSFPGFDYFALYPNFKVGNETSNYKLTIGKFTGTMHDVLSYRNGSQFSTYDRDNDESNENCAKINRIPLWYRDCHDNFIGRWIDIIITATILSEMKVRYI